MSEPLTIVLFGAPMAKERVRVTRTGHAFTPARTVAYESKLALQAQRTMGSRLPFTGPLLVDIAVVMQIPQSKPNRWKEAARQGYEVPVKKPDWDNFAKIVDALNMIVWTDDAQIFRGSVTKMYGDKPMLAIRIREPADRDKRLPPWAEQLQREHTLEVLS